MKGQQAQAAPASPRLGVPIGRFPSAPFDIPTPPLSIATMEWGPAELAGALEGVGVEAFASYLSKSAAHDSRPPEFAPDPEPDPDLDLDLDPSAALLLRVGPAGSERVTRGPSAHRDGLLRLRAAALSVGGRSHLNSTKAPAGDSRPAASRPKLEPIAPSSASRAERGKTQLQEAPSPGEGKRQLNHYRRGN